LGDFFYAGFETVGSTLKWGIGLLAKHPDVQLKVQEEIDAVIGRERPVSIGDRPTMPYTDATISEIQRYASIIPLSVYHEAMIDCDLLGFNIPKGTLLIANTYASHHDPKLWKYPNEFNPKNFLNDDGTINQSQEGVAAFSLGKRQCPGESIARMELFHFIIACLQHFTFRLPDGSSYEMSPPESRKAFRGAPDFKVIISKR